MGEDFISENTPLTILCVHDGLIVWVSASLSGVFQLYHDLTVVHDCILEAVP
jgi:hypothetical protein